MGTFDEPKPENSFLESHVTILRESLLRYSGKDLVDSSLSGREAAEYLYHAPFVLLSHDVAADPVFNYANLSGQKLFAVNWSKFMVIHSRCSAEPVNQQERAQLLHEVSTKGFIDHYQGVRISNSGRRFRISNAIVWNLIAPDGSYYGQAAKFAQWKFLDEKNT